ncbi:unnamed protein product [Adineta steineri]|uniref:EamA domain-containing protein n=1 Tax=Adineta steineri TaxID=433720 RepID=A0A819KNA9_9BILA|nr:unnamed protein product [Adineta steineri]CAF3952002.1 unnamed protein product [Adineta steineri]
MEKKSRTNTVESSPLSPQEAAATLDPLVQPLNDHDGLPVYTRRQSSIFYIPANRLNDFDDISIDEKKSNIIKQYLVYTERFSGILYALLASLLFSCSNFALIKLNIIIFDVLVIRFSVLALISLGFIIYKGYSLYPDCNGILVIIRSIFAAGGSICFYLAISYLPLPDLTTVRYTQVVWTALLALIIFRERITIPTILASILTLAGVICVAQPTFLFPPTKIFNETTQERLTNDTTKRSIGMLVSVTCALAISMSIVLNKKLIQKQVRQSIIMLYFLSITSIVLIIIQIHYWNFSKTRTQEFNFQKIYLTKNFILASFISILQICPMVLSQKAIKREHPSIVTVVQSSDIIFAIILQNMFSINKTNLMALIGSILVIASIFIVGGHKLWLDRQNRMCISTTIPDDMIKVEIKN